MTVRKAGMGSRFKVEHTLLYSPPWMNPLRSLLAFFCHHCPACAYARKRPDSLLGKLLHHPLHADHCPFWKAEKEKYGRP